MSTGEPRAAPRAKFHGLRGARVADLRAMPARCRRPRRPRRPLALGSALAPFSLLGTCLALGAVALAACSDDTTSVAGGAPEAGADAGRSDGSADRDGAAAADASGAGADAATRDATTRDANGPGEAGAECSFNRDCQLALRCECDELAGCACNPGVRGTGRNGLDPCVDGNACASALCVEGPPDSGSFCSDECVTKDDCGGKLPLCADIAFVGRVCIRTPPT